MSTVSWGDWSNRMVVDAVLWNGLLIVGLFGFVDQERDFGRRGSR